ncbi:MAG: asparagine--tRNA ligase [Verrucomicrobia bacterium]|nr:asparagine--tRNA ligase [Verrucomicrobiota bacterium]MBS0646194.1 asparagine--tRNA ligase [Verrucomicrobiota bacterium]
MRTRIHTLHTDPSLIGTILTIKGWVRTVRDQKTFAFIELNDGSCLANLQVIVPSEVNFSQVTTGAAISVVGKLIASPGKNQSVELQANDLEIIGTCPAEDYPLQKKRHSFEFLRTIAHLRPRTNTLGAVTRVRNELAYATHRFFQQQGFVYVHTPILTSSDCEGAGELFRVTTLQAGEEDLAQDFFARAAYLTVSGQLNGEIYASAFKDIYTFGPTFRAENSNTSRHLAEFWMIEPEIAFADLQDDMDLAERYLKFIFQSALDNCSHDMAFFDQFIQKGIVERLQHIVQTPFERLSYTEVVRILEKADQSFEFPVKWGCDFQSEHERYLCEKYTGKPTIVYDYPASIKPFYMRLNKDGTTVANMDVLVPGVGEIIGGSQREERFDFLQQRMEAQGLAQQDYWWYLDLRRYGSTPHAGFGAGFERLVQFVTGMENIRDVIPFPRYPGHISF